MGIVSIRGKRLCLMTFSWALSWRSKARRIMWRKAIERGCQCGGGKSKAGDRSIGESIPWAAEGGFVYALGLIELASAHPLNRGKEPRTVQGHGCHGNFRLLPCWLLLCSQQHHSTRKVSFKKKSTRKIGVQKAILLLKRAHKKKNRCVLALLVSAYIFGKENPPHVLHITDTINW